LSTKIAFNRFIGIFSSLSIFCRCTLSPGSLVNRMDLDLAGRQALVTGSTGGIGLAIATGLAEQGAHVWINGRAPAGVAAATAAIRAKLPAAELSGIAADLLTAEGARPRSSAASPRRRRSPTWWSIFAAPPRWRLMARRSGSKAAS
jgi:hypothetical protein